MRLLLLGLIFAAPQQFLHAQDKKLLNIAEFQRGCADSSKIKPASLKCTITQKQNDSVFYKGALVFCKNRIKNNCSVFFEILDDTILVITCRKNSGMNDPAFLNRDGFYLVNLRLPRNIYWVNLEGRKIARDRAVYDIFINAGEETSLITDINFNKKQIVLLEKGKVKVLPFLDN